jgi:hypothetical protein
MLSLTYALQALGFGVLVAGTVLIYSNKFTLTDTKKVILQITLAFTFAALVFFVANPMLLDQTLCEVTHIMGARTADGTSTACVMGD